LALHRRMRRHPLQVGDKTGRRCLRLGKCGRSSSSCRMGWELAHGAAMSCVRQVQQKCHGGSGLPLVRPRRPSLRPDLTALRGAPRVARSRLPQATAGGGATAALTARARRSCCPP